MVRCDFVKRQRERIPNPLPIIQLADLSVNRDTQSAFRFSAFDSVCRCGVVSL
jgi:hypothetical protein